MSENSNEAQSSGIEMTNDIEKGRPGQLFEDFLKEHGIYEDTTEQAIKRVSAFQLSEKSNKQDIPKVQVAHQLERDEPHVLIDD